MTAPDGPGIERVDGLAPCEAALVIRSEEVQWQLDEMPMAGTLIRPDGDGPFAAVLLVAGSGPTDRDWCSPLLPGSNGSGRLIAEALGAAGIASLRFDKRVAGVHAAEDVPKLIGHLSMRSHLDEVRAAAQVLAAADGIAVDRIVGLGSSEGTLHLLHYATTAQPVPLAGLVLAAPPGRSMRAVLLAQLGLQAAQVPDGPALIAKVEEALDRYEAGAPMDPDPALPESVRMVLAAFEAPANLPFARELWLESAPELLAAVTVPTLVMIGRRDVQIDAEADGAPLQAAAADRHDVTFAFPPTANHVFKEDRRTPAQVAAAPGNGYNEPGTRLDPESLRTMLDWLHRVVG